MTTTHATYAAQQPGPITLDIRLTSGTITIHAEDRDHAEITAEGIDDLGATETGGTVRIRPATQTAAVTDGNVIRCGRGANVVQVGGSSIVVTGSGGIVIGGNSYGGIQVNRSGGGVTSSVTIGSCQNAEIVARVPAGSSVITDGSNVDLETFGAIASVRAATKSGDIEIGHATRVDAKSMSGDVKVSNLGGECRAESMSGDIDIHAVTSCQIKASTMSGNVAVTREPGVELDVDAKSMSGRTRIR
jgi:hypothetical protein